MKHVSLACLFLLALVTPALCAPHLGVVSYWGGNTKGFWKIPAGSIALINPDSGIFVSNGPDNTQTETLAPDLDIYNDVFRRAGSKDIALYGYVPTGYFHHACNQAGKCQTWERIDAQVKAYFKKMPKLTGIFFDETAPADWTCDAYPAEYQKLRDIVHSYRPDARIIFNLGMPDSCAVTAAKAGEMLVLFESDGQAYARDGDKIRQVTAGARAKGVLVWHMINTVPSTQDMASVVATAKSYDPDYLYVVDVSGDWQAGYNTYGALPAYWNDEINAVTGDQDPAKRGN